VGERVDELGGRVDQLSGRVDQLSGRVDRLGDGQRDLAAEQRATNTQLSGVVRRLSRHDERIRKLESAGSGGRRSPRRR
jgi:outer membrane murein-binding lipoprotein Lpp